MEGEKNSCISGVEGVVDSEKANGGLNDGGNETVQGTVATRKWHSTIHLHIFPKQQVLEALWCT